MALIRALRGMFPKT